MDELEMRVLGAVQKMISLRLLVDSALGEPDITLDDILEIAEHMTERKAAVDNAITNYYKALLKTLTEGEP